VSGNRSEQLGVVAAGHPISARIGADVLRDGGNAVDAALGSMLAAFACEPLLTGLGAGGYMLVVAPGGEPVLLDFFVEAPGRGADHDAVSDLLPIDVSFGDALQVFHIGASSVGTFGMPAGICEASRRFGRLELARLVAPAAELARAGVKMNVAQAYVLEILSGIVTSTAEARALFGRGEGVVKAGDVVRQPELAVALERLGSEGSAPFYTGDIGERLVDWVRERGGLLTQEDLRAYQVVQRTPVRVGYRGREVLTNAPPSAGGILIARALSLLGQGDAPPALGHVIEVMELTQRERTPEFLEGLDDPGFVERFLGGASGSPFGRRGGGRLGSTTHVAVLDEEGWACSVTSSNGSCSGVVVPGTGVHLNNMLGEQDLNPLGFHRFPPGRRLPSMMAPTIVLRDRAPELALGSAGSNRIRSAILQTIIYCVDHGMPAAEAVRAPRVHWEDGTVYAEPGLHLDALEREGRTVARFGARNLFFGGVQAAARDSAGRLSGGGDPRRGGAAVVVESP
jgi:gamma-glutamyltranspeptidase/glutathione hydrolase